MCDVCIALCVYVRHFVYVYIYMSVMCVCAHKYILIGCV